MSYMEKFRPRRGGLPFIPTFQCLSVEVWILIPGVDLRHVLVFLRHGVSLPQSRTTRDSRIPQNREHWSTQGGMRSAEMGKICGGYAEMWDCAELCGNLWENADPGIPPPSHTLVRPPSLPQNPPKKNYVLEATSSIGNPRASYQSNDRSRGRWGREGGQRGHDTLHETMRRATECNHTHMRQTARGQGGLSWRTPTHHKPVS